MGFGLVTLILAGIGGWWLRGSDSQKAATVSRFAIPLPVVESIDLVRSGAPDYLDVSISPEGQRIVVMKPAGQSSNQLHLRSMAQLDFGMISDTEGARAPFFSPDGQWVGFFTRGELRKISLHAGTSVTVCEIVGPEQGGSWGHDGSIVFGTVNSGGLMRVSADGGEPEHLSKLREGERWHAWPDLLPDGRAVLLSVVTDTSGTADEGQIHVIDLVTGERRKLLDGGTYPRYSASGHIIFAREHSLFAAPFILAV